jgi:acyl-coenzyme A synthetase/AMP-(fatty) acid ligase
VNGSDVELFRRICAPGSAFLNGLGLTEAGSVRHFFADHRSEIASGPLPVGYPVEDVEILILAEDGAVAAPGLPGEIAVRSRYLASGYRRRPELTRARFLPDPAGGAERIYLTGDVGGLDADGCLVHLGRRDFQVKIRGQRVEVEEVEGALLGLDGIRAAAVTPWDDGSGEPRLVAYLVADRGALPTVSALRRALAAALPAHMIPAAFVPLESMPRTAMGKVDRRALPSPPRARPALDAPPVEPRTPVERELAAIWAEALGLDAVGVEDHFLELGGDSLRAGRIAARAAEQLGVALTPAALFASPTVAAMAVAVVQALLESAERR